jgi:hypothetical protein
MRGVVGDELRRQLNVCHAVLLKQLIKKGRLNRPTRHIATQYRLIVRWLNKLERARKVGAK